MISRSTLVYTSVLFLISAVAADSIPSYIHLCQRNGPDIEKCLFDNFEILRSHLGKGIPEMKIPALDPLFLAETTLEQSNFRASFLNASVYNATQYKVKAVNFDFEKPTLTFVINFPVLNILADYTIGGRILILELRGEGTATADITDLTATAQMNGFRKVKNNKNYFIFDNNTIDLDIGNIRFNFNNLFGKNEQLTKTTNQIINDNSKDFLQELLPLVKEVVASFVFPFASHVFKTFSLEELFPEN
ncbi:PREDICTED: uncharacterized protein LOC108565839 [Nicrophorus vespilloides]|uniref:Uncharacterized protein LOC108565839 n=1 Tax=Nicrophorus vespilloides TaxID=110193 RepID=A0ABM1N2C8_NICVS|nr:PREDICTED: uncharacterized protein LOC108565839 [Nicrophorus vespilloides]